MISKFKLYCLRHPLTNEIRYIGITRNTLSLRLSQHLCCKNKSHKVKWLSLIKKEGLKPIIELIESFETEEEVLTAEMQSIKRHKLLGYNLVNTTIGGEGCSGYKRSPEQNRQHSKKMKGRMQSLITIQKRSESMRGHKVSAETKEKISNSNKNKIRSEQSILNMKIGHQSVKNKDSTLRMIEKTSKPVLCKDTGIIYNSLHQAARDLGLSVCKISLVCNGRRKKTGGYIFEFVNKT